MDKGKDGLCNLMLMDLFEKAYPRANIYYTSFPPYLSDKGEQNEKLLLINAIEWCSVGGRKSDALLRTTFSSMVKNKLITLIEANNLLEESTKILSIPYVALSPSEGKQESVVDKSAQDSQSNQPRKTTENNYCGFKKRIFA